ncbi:MAG: hypothetical protein M1826_005955 [Phylliscum demangeonii]|nr:MAG: hypothetical protein M1826_005955 [Phylliscum demangeonii]
MAVPRLMRLLAISSAIIVCFFLYQAFQIPTAPLSAPGGGRKKSGAAGRLTSLDHDPTQETIGEPDGPLWRATDYGADNAGAPRINATLLSLVRNDELDGMVQSMRDLERTWNSKFNYPWIFFNDEDFTEDFKRRTQAETKAPCRYEKIPAEHWAVPSWIDSDLMAESAKLLREQKVQYAEKVSYHQMCRWNSGYFYKHPALAQTQYYWRVEPNVHFFCDVDYDVFRWMHDHNKTYGFTLNLYDSPQSVASLWPETLKFLAAPNQPHRRPHPNNALRWLTDAGVRPENHLQANGYSTCHFWSNFEIADMTFWRSQVYQEYFDHLDRAGGFFYERWGDAPVHSVALGLFEDAEKIHWFRDIGYQHIPFFNCPHSSKCRGCVPGQFTDGEEFLLREDCRPAWFRFVGTG